MNDLRNPQQNQSSDDLSATAVSSKQDIKSIKKDQNSEKSKQYRGEINEPLPWKLGKLGHV